MASPLQASEQGAAVMRRVDVFVRLLAAVFGGYALATLLSLVVAGLFPMPRADAAMTALLLSFAVYTAAILWAFAARSAGRAWAGLLLPALPAGLWLLLRGVGA